MTITIDLPPETEAAIRKFASESDMTVEEFIIMFIKKDLGISE